MIFPKIILRPSKIHVGGVGVFAARMIKKGERVGLGITEYKRVFSWHSLNGNLVARKWVESFCWGTPTGFYPPRDLDFNLLLMESYMNHSCEGNVGFNLRGEFVAIKSISIGGELCCDYGLAESNPSFIMECSCGSVRCRNIITGNDWKDSEYHKKNKQNMLPALRRNT